MAEPSRAVVHTVIPIQNEGIEASWQNKKNEEKENIEAHFQENFFKHTPPSPITEKIRTILDRFKQGPDPSWMTSFLTMAAKTVGTPPRTELFNEIDALYQRASKTLAGITPEALTTSDCSGVVKKKEVTAKSAGAYSLKAHRDNDVEKITSQLLKLSLLSITYPFSTLCDYKRIINLAQSQLLTLQLLVEEELEKVHAKIPESDQTRDEKLVKIITEQATRITSIMEKTKKALLDAVSSAALS